MDEKYADLHVHTNYSDGTYSPDKVVQYAASIGLSAIGITDHDNTDGLDTAIKEAEKTGIEILPGVELSVELKNSAKDEIHILGYLIVWQDEVFQQKLSVFKKAREHRAQEILDKLSKLGIRLDAGRLREIAGIGALGRLHIARLMVEEQVSAHIREAFWKYLGNGRPAYVPKYKMMPEEAVKMILDVSGVPVLAHPYHEKIDNGIIKSLVDVGLKGIEVFHTKHTPDIVEKLKKTAEKYNLIQTGGSDCHGPLYDSNPIMGSIKVPYSVVEGLKQAKTVC